MIWAYLAGFVTGPALYGALIGTLLAARTVDAWLWKRGWSVEFKGDRDTESISDYRLRNDIWWEQQYGPIFLGLWCREDSYPDKPKGDYATRWLGIGNANGRCLVVYRLRRIGTGSESAS